jgi:hypothetical protein
VRVPRSNFVAIAAGYVPMLVAVVSSLITFANREAYRGALLTALGCALLALACLAVPVVRGPRAWRIAAIVLASPALFVFEEFARRAPYVFGGGIQ